MDIDSITTTNTNYMSWHLIVGLFSIFFFFLIWWLLQTHFISYYRSYLKEKIREWIVWFHLDSSGESIQRNLTYKNPILDMVDLTERYFNL